MSTVAVSNYSMPTNPAASATTSEAPAKKELTANQASLQNRQMLNSQILSSSLNLSLKADNQTMSLLFKTALERVQAEFNAEFSNDEQSLTAEATTKPENNPYETEVDNSPQATADRIMGMAAGFYAKYKERNAENPDVVGKFMEIFSGGIDKGFADAKDILKSLDKLNGKVATDIDETYSLVQKGLKSFQEKMMEAEKAAKTPASTPA